MMRRGREASSRGAEERGQRRLPRPGRPDDSQGVTFYLDRARVKNEQPLRGRGVGEHASLEEDRNQPPIRSRGAMDGDRACAAIERDVADTRVAEGPARGRGPAEELRKDGGRSVAVAAAGLLSAVRTVPRRR